MGSFHRDGSAMEGDMFRLYLVKKHAQIYHWEAGFSRNFPAYYLTGAAGYERFASPRALNYHLHPN